MSDIKNRDEHTEKTGTELIHMAGDRVLPNAQRPEIYIRFSTKSTFVPTFDFFFNSLSSRFHRDGWNKY